MLAERWGTSDQFIYDAIRRGNLKAMKLGGKLLRIRAEDVARYEQQQAQTDAEKYLPASDATRDPREVQRERNAMARSIRGPRRKYP